MIDMSEEILNADIHIFLRQPLNLPTHPSSSTSMSQDTNCSYIIGDYEYLNYCINKEDWTEAQNVWENMKSSYLSERESIHKAELRVGKARMDILDTWKIDTMGVPMEVNKLANAAAATLLELMVSDFEMMLQVYANAFVYSYRMWKIKDPSIILYLPWLHYKIVDYVKREESRTDVWDESKDDHEISVKTHECDVVNDSKTAHMWVTSKTKFATSLRKGFDFMNEEPTNRPKFDKSVKTQIVERYNGSEIFTVNTTNILAPLMSKIFGTLMRFSFLKYNYVNQNEDSAFIANISVEIPNNNKDEMKILNYYSCDYLIFEPAEGGTTMTRLTKFTMPKNIPILNRKKYLAKCIIDVNKKTLKSFEKLTNPKLRKEKRGSSFTHFATRGRSKTQ